jgi:hypothetical protein
VTLNIEDEKVLGVTQDLKLQLPRLAGVAVANSDVKDFCALKKTIKVV